MNKTVSNFLAFIIVAGIVLGIIYYYNPNSISLSSTEDVKNILSDFQKYEHTNTTIEAYYKTAYSKLNFLGITATLEDKNGYQLDAVFNIQNKVYINGMYKFTGEITPITLCECLVKDTYTADVLSIYSSYSDILHVSDWYGYKRSSLFNPYNGEDNLPNIDSYTTAEICTGKKRVSNDVGINNKPRDSWVRWDREYMCGNNNITYYYFNINNAEKVE